MHGVNTNQFDYVYDLFNDTVSKSYYIVLSCGMMNDKLAWMSKGPWPNQSYVFGICQQGLRRTMKYISVRIICLTAEIWIKNLLNKSKKCYSLSLFALYTTSRLSVGFYQTLLL